MIRNFSKGVAARRLMVAPRRFMATAQDEDTVTITVPEDSFAAYELEAPDREITLPKKELIKLYKDMVTIRRLEMASDALYKAKKIRGFCHLSTGQEAIAAAIEASITETDSVITAYRCHGFTHMRGASVRSVIAELLGKETGCSSGKGGSMHMFTPNFYGGNGIVGAQVPLGLGIGFAHLYNKQDAACFTLYGDGASNQGQVFESFNMAKLWNVPVIFACENNKYGMGTSAARSSAITEFYKRGQYIPGLKINGMDSIACLIGSRFAREWCVSGKGPIVLEYETYRYGGHSMSDPGTTYRTREEIQNMRSKHDCVTGLKVTLEEQGILTEKEIKALDKELRSYVDAEVQKAVDDPFPETTKEVFFKDVYYHGSEPAFIRGRYPEENIAFQ